MEFDLLKTLCAIPGTSGDEGKISEFITKYFAEQGKHFKTVPQVYSGPGFQDMVIAVFGKPRTAIFAHTDTVGYTVAHNHELFMVGGPKAKEGTTLIGQDAKGPIECTIQYETKKKNGKIVSQKAFYKYKRVIAPGTLLTYETEFKETKQFVKNAYLDNRLGVWNALMQAHTMTDGALVFSTYEEHGGGAAEFAGRFLQKGFGVQQALISDVTLLSDSIKHHKGVAISMRDRGIPRRSYLNRIIQLAEDHKINYQLEVEKAGGSDGNALQSSSYVWDWCFVGPPEANYHEPGEKVSKKDIEAMLAFYKVLIEKL